MANWHKIVQTRSGLVTLSPLGPVSGSLGEALKRAVDNTAQSQVSILGFVDLDKAGPLTDALQTQVEKR